MSYWNYSMDGSVKNIYLLYHYSKLRHLFIIISEIKFLNQILLYWILIFDPSIFWETQN